MNLRPIHAAALCGDYAAVLRLARAGRGWTQSQLGQRANLSRTVISRFETGDRALRDVELRRRSFLVAAGAAILPTEHSLAKADPMATASVQVLTQRVEQALIHPDRGRVLGPTVVLETLTAARVDYRATRYLPMVDRLVNLVASAEAQIAETAEPTTYTVVADVYNAVANLLCKLPPSGLEWMAPPPLTSYIGQAGRTSTFGLPRCCAPPCTARQRRVIGSGRWSCCVRQGGSPSVRG